MLLPAATAVADAVLDPSCKGSGLLSVSIAVANAMGGWMRSADGLDLEGCGLCEWMLLLTLTDAGPDSADCG